jgi:TonB-linked SusC/RagA family outer membrane protein
MKKFKRTIILCICAFFSFTVVFSQQKLIIRGRVIDKNDKSVIIGANIVEYDKDNRVINGTVCNSNGEFVLELKSINDIVKVSYIGYNTSDVVIDPAKSLVVELESSALQMQEIVVTAQAKGRSVTNIDDRDKASSSVKMDLRDMKESGALSVADALQGRISGLDILSAGGDPGTGARIVIRGLSSVGNSKPLIVIDGIPQSSPPNYDQFNLGSANVEDIGTLINVPVQDIKSVEVLKDGASTAAYGSKGADGVLLIETHKGRRGKVRFDYTYKNSINIQPPAIPMLNGNEYIMLQREELHNKLGIYPIPDGIAYNRNSTDFFNYSQNTDWIGALTTKGITNDHYFSVSGGGEKAAYFASMSYIDEGGTTINTAAKTFSTRLNLDYQLSKKIRFSINFNYTHLLNNYSYNGLSWDMNIREMAYIKAPNMSILEYDAFGKLTGNYFTPIYSYQGNGISYYNPVAIANLGKNDQTRNNLANSFSFSYAIAPWLTFMETATLDLQGGKNNAFIPYNALGQDWLSNNVNKADEENGVYQNFKTQSQLSFNVPFTNQKHALTGAFTWETEMERDEKMRVGSNKLPSVQIQDPSASGQISGMGSSLSEKRYLHGVLNVNYKFNDRYLFQAVIIEDAHSVFGSNNRWGLFSGYSAGWRFGKENFIKGLSFLGEESKIRASWGSSGRLPHSWISNYIRFATYGSPDYPKSYKGDAAVIPKQIELSNLRWETTSTSDLGCDLFLFKDRLSVTAELYRKMTFDIENDGYKIPLSSGFKTVGIYNGGQLLNKGWEAMIDYKIIQNQKQDFMVSFNFNISQNENSFIKLPDNFNKENSTDLGNGNYPKIIVENRPIGSFYGLRYKGVYATDADAIAKDAEGKPMHDANGNLIPMKYKDSYVFRGGDAIYEDINHDGKIDLNDVVYLGNSNPRFYGGMGPSIKYKNFTFRADFQYRVGSDIVNMIALKTQGMGDYNNQSKAVLRRWRAQGQNEPDMLPRAYLDNPANNLGSDRYVENGDFLRLVNVMASYRISQKICDKLHIRSLSMTLSARKIYTLTRYSGQDPEVGQNAADPFWIGADNSRTPPPQIVTCAISIGL